MSPITSSTATMNPATLAATPGRTAPARKALLALFRSESHVAPAIARVALGIVILPHGAQKLLGWFGGYGFAGTMHWFTDVMHIPWMLGFAAILAETLGGFALVAGFATRLAALAIAAVFGTAVALVHWQHGFFVNWFGTQQGEGIEYFILGLALAAIVAIYGGGAASLDRVLVRRVARRVAVPETSAEN